MDKRRLIWDLSVGALIVCLFGGLFASDFRVFDRLDEVVYDTVLRFRPTKMEAQVPAVLVHIDEKSLNQIGPWPWPPNILSRMVDILRYGEARIIGLDLPLPGDGLGIESKEAETLRRRVQAKNAKERAGGLVGSVSQDPRRRERDDLQQALQGAGNVILGLRGRLDPSAGRPIHPGPPTKEFLKPERPVPPDKVPKIFVPDAMPDAALQETVLGLGHAVLQSEWTSSRRSHMPYALMAGGLFPSYALRLAIGYLGLSPSQARVEPGGIVLGDRRIPICRHEMLLSFPTHREEALPQYGFSEILAANKAPSGMKDKIVLISMHTVGAERLSTPSERSIPRGQYVAYVLADLLCVPPIYRPQGAREAELITLLVLVAFSTFVFSRFSEGAKLGWFLGVCALILLVQGLALAFWHVWFKSGLLLAALGSLYFLLMIKRSFAAERSLLMAAGATRALAQNLQRQGMLDLALEAFAACPGDGRTRDLVYQLGLEYEQKGMGTRALDIYENLRRRGRYRDLDERMERLKKQNRAGGADIEPAGSVDGVLSDSFLRARRTVGRYRILELIGKGTMGLVYKALDPKINRLLAIKVIRFSDEFDEETIREIRSRFFREAEIAGQISHPSIVTIHDVGEDQDLTYMAMEYLEGKDLSHYCTRDNLLPIPKTLHVVAGVAEALEHAHRADVIHRDIKPANIMLLDQGGIKVTDFGIAKAISSSKTKTGVILGTPNYMSPEQIMGRKIDARTDIFSLGVLLFHLLTGDLPFHGRNLSNLLFQITQAKPRSARSFNPRIPKACEQIISKALSKDPNARFQSAGEMAKYLRILIGKIEEIGRKTRTVGAEESLSRRRNMSRTG